MKDWRHISSVQNAYHAMLSLHWINSKIQRKKWIFGESLVNLWKTTRTLSFDVDEENVCIPNIENSFCSYIWKLWIRIHILINIYITSNRYTLSMFSPLYIYIQVCVCVCVCIYIIYITKQKHYFHSCFTTCHIIFRHLFHKQHSVIH